MLQCIASYDPVTTSYNIRAVWRFRSPLVAETIRLVTAGITHIPVDGTIVASGRQNRTILDHLEVTTFVIDSKGCM